MNRRSRGWKNCETNRKRDVHFHFWANEEEAALIQDRMSRIGVTNLGAYMRKAAIDGFFINLDMTCIKELITILRYCSNNLNQYAKRANETGSIYTADIEDLRTRLDEIWEAVNNILISLAEI